MEEEEPRTWRRGGSKVLEEEKHMVRWGQEGSSGPRRGQRPGKPRTWRRRNPGHEGGGTQIMEEEEEPMVKWGQEGSGQASRGQRDQQKNCTILEEKEHRSWRRRNLGLTQVMEEEQPRSWRRRNPGHGGGGSQVLDEEKPMVRWGQEGSRGPGGVKETRNKYRICTELAQQIFF
jgi:hypothetical protein